jgi:hypothetical protein
VRLDDPLSESGRRKCRIFSFSADIARQEQTGMELVRQISLVYDSGDVICQLKFSYQVNQVRMIINFWLGLEVGLIEKEKKKMIKR